MIRKRRRIKNLSQTEVAGHIGVTHTTISRYENGKIDIPVSVLPKIGECCGFGPSEYIRAFCTDEEVRKAIRRIAAGTQDYFVKNIPASISAEEDTLIETMPEEIKPVIVTVSEYIVSHGTDSINDNTGLRIVKECFSMDQKQKAFTERMTRYFEKYSEIIQNK